MIEKECVPCTVENLQGPYFVLLLCAFGVLAELAFVLLLKGLDIIAAIRVKRLIEIGRL